MSFDQMCPSVVGATVECRMYENEYMKGYQRDDL